MSQLPNPSPKDVANKYLAEIYKTEAQKKGVPIEIQQQMLKTILGSAYQEPTKQRRMLDDLITSDIKMLELKNKVEKLNKKPQLNVLILGETGTGKEVIANSLHEGSKGPFIGVNCAGIPQELFESEFFGVMKGAYTGCTTSRSGYFEQAQNGTIFLDEIAEIPYYIQCKLLRVIETRKIRRIGDSMDTEINCRIVSATNNINIAKETTRFRQDLFYRLRGSLLETIPLRDRRDDIRLIVPFFDKQDKIPVEVIEGWINDEETYKFDGNVRELRNMVEEYLCLNGE